ncbi:MAG: helix-turn-helix transcriptional regulator [Gammaproteobacteria bacterium]|nr:helix-turn-helix transcriptional regulator [Gammaproteobacteria bacterium]
MAERVLANRLKEARTRLGLTQAELALMAGVSRKTINTVENGIFIPSTVLALVLARTLKMRVEELFYLVEV